METDAERSPAEANGRKFGSQQKEKTKIPVRMGFRSRCKANKVQRRSPFFKGSGCSTVAESRSRSVIKKAALRLPVFFWSAK
jgi:hypothetical protein